MDGESLVEQVRHLRQEGQSIRSIASQLAIHPSRVQRMLKSLGHRVIPSSDFLTDQWVPQPNRGAGVFVGRQREMGQLQSALEDAISSWGRLVMLVGEPGIGKTRTAQELASRAETRGAHVLWGWCYEEGGAPPSWPWVQPIRSYVQRADSDQLRAEMGPGAADIAEVVGEIHRKLPHLEPPPALEPEHARFRLFDSITTFLKSAAQSQPLMVVLDDLHWADKPSLLLLEFLARQLANCRLLVVGCYRDAELPRQHPLSDTLAQLSRLPVFQRALLRGMSPEDTSHFIETIAGVQPPQRLVENIYAYTEGNPFFMKEMIRLVSERGDLAAEIAGAEGIKVPEGVREVIGQRLNRLSEQCNQTLSVASVIGKQFDFQLLKKLNDELTEEQLLEVIDEAIDAHLIEAVSGGRELYQFSHTLIQQALSEELSTSRRVRLHARIGEALGGQYGNDAGTHAAALVYHFTEAEPVVGFEKLVHYSLLAGEQALAAYAYEEALTYFQQALAAKGVPLTGNEPARDAEEATLLFGADYALAASRDHRQMAQTVAILRRAFDYYVRVGDLARAVTVAESTPRTYVGQDFGEADLVSRAMELVAPDSREAGYLLARYAEVRARVEGDYDDAQEAFSRAQAIAQREGDVALEMRVLAKWAVTDYSHLRKQECLAKSLRIIQLARLANEPIAEANAFFSAGMVLWSMGDLDGSRRHAVALLALAERLRDRFWLASAFWRNESIARAEGDWRTARTFSDQGLALAAPRLPQFLSTRVYTEYQAGEFSQGEMYLERLLGVVRQMPPGPSLEYAFPALVIPMVARITGALDQVDIAEAAARTVLSSPSANPLPILLVNSGLALLAMLRQDGVAARKQYLVLEAERGTMLPPTVSMAADHLLGLLAQTMGWLDQAMTHFEDALTFCRKAGYRPELAWTCCDYAAALLQRDHNDRARAMALLDGSLTIAQELGMHPLMGRVVACQERAQSLRPAPTYPNGLTHREVEVLGLIALGKSNREIAQSLILSVKTVDRHVSNIFTKAGVSNRTEASLYATRHRLASW